jgi:hypothetical protein
MKVEPNKKMVH